MLDYHIPAHVGMCACILVDIFLQVERVLSMGACNAAPHLVPFSANGVADLGRGVMKRSTRP